MTTPTTPSWAAVCSAAHLAVHDLQAAHYGRADHPACEAARGRVVALVLDLSPGEAAARLPWPPSRLLLELEALLVAATSGPQADRWSPYARREVERARNSLRDVLNRPNPTPTQGGDP